VRDAEGSAAAQAVFAYWDLTLAQHRMAHTLEKVAMGERLLAQARAASRQGRLPESQVMDVESDLIRYRAAVVEARTAQAEAAAQIAAVLGDSLENLGGRPRAVEALPAAARALPDADQAMARAREARADLRQRRAALEREQIQTTYALNQARPKVDVVASYGFNGGPGRSQAVGVGSLKDFPAWTVGLQVAMPLGDNQQARADIQAARLRAQEAERQLQALEVTIGNDIRTGLALMAGAAERWSLWSEVARREERHVVLERQRLEAGRSDIREVLFREEKAINARLAVIEQQVAWAKADTLVEAAQGTLLERYP
jgi:outer membrane protein TolC